jgi:hypothetical protein
MKILAARIKRQLLLDTTKWGHCAIYENELQRIWPLNEENRKAKIEQFAKEYGFCLSFYRAGCVRFLKKNATGKASRMQYWQIITDNLSKPVGAGAVCQPLSFRGGRSGLLTRIVAMGSVSLCVRMKS